MEAWRQGKDLGIQPCMMIAGCIVNRQRLGWGQWFDVLAAIPKFSALLEQPNRDVFPDVWEPNFIKLLHAVPAFMDGSMPDPAFGGLYWADTKHITNPWFKEKILGSPLHTACANQNSFTVFR